MVIEARAKQPKEFYDSVSAAIAAGAVEAFYHFLLNFPLDGFDEHTKPLMTLAKERVIEFGLNSWMSFHRAWKSGYGMRMGIGRSDWSAPAGYARSTSKSGN
jgi:hypothetical protein